MKQIWIITKRELATFFDSLMAYIVLALFLGFTGFFTWFGFSSNVFAINQASLSVFFGVAFWTIFIFTPALTMRLIAEENRSGTIELLLTKPISHFHVIMGKFLSTLILIAIALLLTIPYYVTIANIGPVDHSAVWCGYLGLLLMSASYISIGLFTSSISNNQIVAFLLALIIGVFFHFLFGMIAAGFSGTIAEIFNFLSLSTHYDSISRGVIDSKDVIYFLSIIFIGILSTEVVLARKTA